MYWIDELEKMKERQAAFEKMQWAEIERMLREITSPLYT